MSRSFSLLFFLALFASASFFQACDKSSANIEFQSNNDGDFTGNGGDAKDSREWDNNFQQAEYNMDITSDPKGSVTLTIEDANGETVIQRTIQASDPNDSVSGITKKGKTGTWTITVEVKDFDGDGSFSVSQND